MVVEDSYFLYIIVLQYKSKLVAVFPLILQLLLQAFLVGMYLNGSFVLS